MSNNNPTLGFAPLDDDVLIEIDISDYNCDHDYYRSHVMDNFSVNFTLQEVDRVILSDNYDNNNEGRQRVEIMNSSFKLLNTSPTIAFNPNDVATLYNIDFCLRFCLNLDDQILRQEVVRELQAYIESNPRPVSLAVSINRIEEYLSTLYDQDEDEDDQLSERNPAKESDIATLKRIKVKDVGLKKDDEEMCCSICLEKLLAEELDVTITYMPCKHCFHDDCIVKWLKACPYCPICRFELGKQTEIV